MKKRLIPAIILIIYSAMLVIVMVFKIMPVIRLGPLMFKFGGTQEGSMNLIPFKTILPYLLGDRGFIIGLTNIAGNILLLVPVGFLVPFVYKNITWKKSLVLAVATGFAIEATQALLHVGIFDIDDMILNGLGVMLGYWTFIITTKKIRWTRPKIIVTSVVIIIAATTALYSFAFNNNRRLQFSAVTGANNINADTGKVDIAQPSDPCGGTGGTGQIISIGNHTITIKRHDGVNEIIKLTKQTKIKNAMGPLSESDLKKGNRVTVVIGLDPKDSKIATLVLVCNETNLKSENKNKQ